MEEVKYTKDEIREAARFKKRRDLVDALLKKDCVYSIEEAEEIITGFMEGSV